MNTELRKNEKKNDFFKLMNNAIVRKTMRNVRNHRDIELITTEVRGNCLVPEPNYHTTKKFSDNVLAREMKRTQTPISKPVYLGLPILEISKVAMHEFWYSYVNLMLKIM